MLKSFFAFPNQFKACAVCVPDGANLMLYGMPPRLQEAHGLSADEAVTFRQLSLEVHTYKDAVEFKNGLRVRLQELDDGQSVQVLALSEEKAEVPGRAITVHAS